MPGSSFTELFQRGKAVYEELFGVAPDASGLSVSSIVPGASGATDIALAHLFGEVYCRNQLTLKQRSFTVVSVLIALGKEPELQIHFGGLMNQGYHPDQLQEMCLHLAHYVGWPNCVAARRALDKALADEKNQSIVQRAQQQQKPGRKDLPYQTLATSPSEQFERGKLLAKTLTGRDGFMRLAPDGGFNDVTFGHLFGNIWCRPDLSILERVWMVNAALMALGKEDALKAIYIQGFLHSGGTREQLEEMALHIANYAGWPACVGARRALAAVAPIGKI